MKRRSFIKAVGGVAAFSVLPRRLIAGSGATPPSETVCVAAIGAGGRAASDIEGFLEGDFKFLVPDLNYSISAYVYYSKFPSLGEEVRTEDIRSLEDKFLIYRNSASGYDAVVHRIYHVDFVRNHNVLHQEFLTDGGSVIAPGIFWMRGMADLAVDFHNVIL